MKELTLEQIKKRELDILIEIDRFCRQNGIRYSLCGGALIGAVRHKGFIPWDDDIDLNMTRDQFNRFVELFSKEQGRYRLITHRNNPQYNYLFAKVVDTNTCLIEDHNFPIDDLGIFVDIFPVDPLGETKEIAEAKVKKIKFKRFLCVAACWKKFYINRSRSLLRQIPRFLFYILSRFIDVHKTNVWMESQFPFEENKAYWGCFSGSYEEREIMEKDVFNQHIDMEFEGHQFMVMRKYDTFLKNIYNNYMELPPEEKRVAHHTFRVYDKMPQS